MRHILHKGLTIALGCFLAASAWAQDTQGIEVQTPDGPATLFDDGTWEYNRPAPVIEATTVSADDIVLKPSAYRGEHVVVNGKITRVFGKYLLSSESGQNTMGINIDKMRRADQIALEAASKAAGLTGAVNAQIQGKVKLATVTYFLEARELIILP